MKKYAWYFPNWHVTELNEKWHGKGWTEWECVKYATPRFEGHVQPKVPLWGYEDESDPVVFEKKIKTALDYGIDGFIFDFYWFSCGPYRRDCLDKGFLGAPNNEDCEFSIMWANHDPVYVHPAPYMHTAPELLSGIVDKELFKEVTQFCIDNYFWRKNYQRVDGKIFYGVWDVIRMVKEFGSLEECAKVFEDFRERARKAGHELFLAAANKNLFPGFKEKDKELFEKTVDALGIEMVMTYSWPNIYPKDGWPAIEYAEAREEYFKTVPEDVEFSKVPFCIAASTGWDSSPRTVQSDKYEDSGYPYLPIQVNNTPEEVEKTFRMCKEWIESGKVTGNILTISTWNEWTEGNYMEPDEQYGYGFLEAFKRVFSE
ncbi:MAG: hypothetical protein E7539_05360 [Ruminococcaceae bacterium]|nr:hypothetical protein [Oscillospiraceae bacterium]